MNKCIFAFVNREPTALLMEICDEGTDYLEKTLPEHVTVVKSLEEVDPKKFKLVILVTPYNLCVPYGVLELHFVPMIASLGFGLASHPDNYEDIYDEIDETMSQIGVLPCYKCYCTIDVKQDEEFCAMLVDDLGEELVFYSAEELAKVEVPNPSKTVQKHVGTPSVCEAAAILGANNGKLIVPKVKGRNWTAALAIDYKYLREKHGHIEIVGAGPGDPDLVSVRGRKMLERADLILYAGSLVPKALTECHKPGAVVRSSADMALEEQCVLMKQFYDEGKFIVRLHTGDPCIFGAIQEQMAFFDANRMDYHITPGISSFLAAAAELQSQFTIPERCQTIILTRGEGRTPMPEKEQLHLLAKSQSTMCIFLSASIVDDVQRELLQEYPEDTPVAACYHLTWPDQKIYRGVLKDLAKIVHDNHLTLTTMLVVGEAIDNREGLSALYDKHFTHLFRKGDIS
jgi:precorrin-4 C11-methyltransferase